MVPAIIALFIWKLPLGIDFAGGTQFELAFEKPVSQEQLQDKMTGYDGVKGLQLSSTETNTYLIRLLPITNEQYQKTKEKLGQDFGPVTEKQYQSVQPSVSKDLTRKAIWAVILASLMIIVYLAISFRGVTYPVSSWQFGTTAVVALAHDLLISVGLFSIVAHYLNYQVDASFITALLTIMGFSVHDSIVVFDRVRENLVTHKNDSNFDFELIVDQSIGQTLNRSLATSLTVVFTLLTLVVLGGESIRGFVATLLIGIVVGTYSSIFTASPLLVVWQKRNRKRT